VKPAAARSLQRLCLSWGLTLLAAAASGQGRHGGLHPLPARGPSLQERIVEADAIAVTRVRSVEPDRLEVERVRAIIGELPRSFQVKRSPLRPPPLEAGDRALLLLRGARSPFVLAGEPRETIRLEDDSDARTWTRAVETLVAAGDDPKRLLALHLEWLDGPDERLRSLAVVAFLDPRSRFGQIPRELSQARARIAADPSRPLPVRRTSASIAVLHAAGASELLAHLPLAEGAADPLIVELALRAAAANDLPGAEQAFLRTLRHPDPTIRRRGLQAASSLAAPGSELRDEVARMAARDPDARVKRRAESLRDQLERRPR
jgi:hypothetical protein